MPPAALIVILMILKTVKDNDYWQIFALSSVFGGAVGNYIDRLRFRYVVDFLDFHIQEKFTWPAFNVADTAIVCGVCILLVLMVLEQRQMKKASQKA
jgi:signal peptidase II